MSESRQPFFSVIIPTHDRPERLAACLHSLALLDYPRDRFEVIVVDDGSPQPLDGVAANFKEQCNLVLLRQEKNGPATARNNGARQAQGDFLVFIDDDCAPAPDYLRRLAAHIVNTPDCVIGGRTINALADNFYATTSQMLIDYLYSYYNADPNHARFLTSNNMALPASYFHALNGFDASFSLAAGEDRELCDRWSHRGYRLIYAPDAVVYHSHVLTLRKFWRQHFNYGRGAFAFHQARRRRVKQGVKLEPLSFYINLLRYPFSQKCEPPAFVLATLLVVSQAANAAGFFFEPRAKLKTNREASSPVRSFFLNDMLPLFSVIVPTFNRPRQLAACLQALAQLDYPCERFEVIVVDDGSATVLDNVIAEAGRQINVRLLRQANAGPAAARNTGAKQAQGEFLAFIDDDCTPASNWLTVLAQHFNAAPEAMVGGRAINPLTQNPFTAASQLIHDLVYRHYNADPQHARFFGAANLAIPAQRFRELGGFMPNFRTSEDRELCDRWLQRGWPMIYAPEAIIYHTPHLTFAGFCKQHFSYGRGAYRYHQIRQQRSSGTMRQEMRFHANWRNWLLHPFTQVKGKQAFAWAGLLVVWQVANAAGFFWERLNQKGLETSRPPANLRE